MSKLWLIAVNEYKRNVFKKSFIFTLLSVPAFLGFIIGMGIISSILEKNNDPVGYVDHAGVLENPVPGPVHNGDERIELIPYTSEEEARGALDAEEIQAYFVLAPDYMETLETDLVYFEEPSRDATQQFFDFLQTNLLSDLPLEQAQLIALGPEMTIRSADGSREYPDGGPPFSVTLPAFIAVAFVILLMMSSGYAMDGIAQERENRTMEVIMTSVSSLEMVIGKVIGIVGINLTQVAVWIAIGLLAVFLGGQVFDVAWLQNPEVDWRGIGMVVGIALPNYLLAASIMFMVGTLVAQTQDAQAIGPLLFITFMLPTYAMMSIGNEPNGTIAVTMSLLPFTSLTTIALRYLLISVPLWQFVLSFVIQSTLALFALWLASRAFRIGMLRYGQKTRLSELFRRSEIKRTAIGELTG